MNKISFTFFIGFVATLMFSACTNADKYAAELKELDSLSLLLDSAVIEFEAIDTVKIQKSINELTVNLDFIEKNNRDTVSRETAFLLSDYSLLRTPLQKLYKAYVKNAKELKLSQEQVKNLIHDIKVNKVEESKIATYVLDERSAIHRVSQDVEIMTILYKDHLEKFEMNNPKVLEFIETIKAKQALPK